VLALADRLVSWGDEGGIRFWSLEGTPLPGGAADAHSDVVRGMLALGDCLVSYGQDGAIRFWSSEGNPLDILVVPGGISGLYFRFDRLIAVGRTLWIYELARCTPERSAKAPSHT